MISKTAATANLGVGIIWLLGAFLFWQLGGYMTGLFSSMHELISSLPNLILFFAGPLLLISGSVMLLRGQKHLVSLMFVVVSSIGLIGIVAKTLYDALHPVPLEGPVGFTFYFVFVTMLVITSAATLILLLNYIRAGKLAGIESGRGA